MGSGGPVRTRCLALVIVASLAEWAISWGSGVPAEMSVHVDSDGQAWPSGASPWGFSAALSWLCHRYELSSAQG